MTEGNCFQGVSGGQITIRRAIPSNSIKASAVASWSRVASKTERPAKALGWQLRLELLSSWLIATPAVVPQRTRQRRQLELLNVSRIDATGLVCGFVQLDKVSERDWGDGDITIGEWVKT